MTDQLVDFALLGAEWVLYLLVILSVLSVGIMFERGLFLRDCKVDGDELLRSTVRALAEDDATAVKERFGNSRAMSARIALAALNNRAHGLDAVGEAMNSAKSAAKNEYERNLFILGTLGNNAPFIGLFGTVLGIIQAFHDLKTDPTGGVNAVMGSVSEALVATAVGILVAIPAVVAFNVFNRKLRAALTASDTLAHAVLSELHAQGDHGEMAEAS